MKAFLLDYRLNGNNQLSAFNCQYF